MKALLPLLGMMLLAGSGFAAGTDAIIKQHAKDLATQNNNRYGAPPSSQPAQPPGMPAPPPAPTLAPSLTKFQTELGALQAGSLASADQQQKLAQEVLAGAQNAKPSSNATTKFVKDLSEAFAEKPLTALNRARLVQGLDAVLNPGKYPQAKLEGIFAQIQTMFHDNALSQTKADALAEDVKAMSAEIQRGGAK